MNADGDRQGFYGYIPLARYVSDLDLLKEMLLLLSYHAAGNAERLGIKWNRAVLSVEYANGERIDWGIPVSQSGGGHTVFMKTAPMLYMVPRHPVRLIGLRVCDSDVRGFVQSTFGGPSDRRDRSKDCTLESLAERLGLDPAEMSGRLLDIGHVRTLAERLRRERGR